MLNKIQMKKTKQKNFNIGTVKMTMESNGFPKGFKGVIPRGYWR